jgi:hypothetical protein
MKKKDKRKALLLGEAEASKTSAQPSIISKRGWKVIGIGIAVAILGYVVLSFTDPRGQNWASRLSPFLILGGYATIGFGIVAKDPS